MLNRILIFFICLSLFATQLYAGPASPDLIEVTQPDGSSFKIRKQGDEFQNWTETETGYTVLKNKKTKEWEYAIKASDGTLGLSGQKVVPQQKTPTNVPLHLKPPRNTEAEKKQSQILRDIYLQRLPSPSSTTTTQDSTSSYATGDWTPLPVSGTRKIIVIMVNFTNRALITTATGWSNSVFSTTPGVKSVANYYKDNSFNTLAVTPVSHTQPDNPAGVVTVSIDYVHPDNGTAEATWVAAAINAAASYVNFASLDTNGNGYIDRTEAVVYLIPAGYEESGSSKIPSVWAHATSYYSGGLSAAGKLFPAYAMNGELNDSNVQHPIGVIAHEMGHQFCGLPDLYDTSSQNQGLGNFSLMASGSWGANIGEYSGSTPTNLDIWSREYLGWATPQVPSTSGTLSLAHPLSAQNAAYKFISPTVSTTEYYLIENRQPVGWDLGLRGKTGFGSSWAGGLLITHIDITAGTVGYNDINKYTANAGRQGVIPVQASTAACDMLSVGASCRGNATTLYYSANNTSWGPSTTPNSNYYSGAATNFSLTGISAPAATMTGSFSFIPPVTKTLTVSKNGTGSGTVTSSPTGISCGSTCSAGFLQNETVTLTAAGDPNSIFTGWSGGGCTGIGTCVVSLADNTTVTATFATATLGEVLNIPGITVTTSGNANWFPESSTSHDGSSAAQSGDIADSQTSSMQFTVTGPGTLSFWWKVSSEANWDKLKFYIDGTEPASVSGGISGNVDWTQVSGIAIPSGTHTLSWTYSKDGSVSSGSDTGWVDQIFMEHTLEVWIEGAGSGSVLINPYAITCSTSGGCATNYNLGTLVTLIATPSGSSTFGGWNGCTTPSGTTCNLIMDERKSVTATFNAPHKVKIYNGASYETISDGYEAANSGDVIMLVQDTFNSDLTLNLNKAVTLSGGWYPDFHGLTGLYSYLQGILTVASGSLTVENLIIK